MKSRILMCIMAMTLLAALASVGLTAHEHRHYKLIDMGTFGGALTGTNFTGDANKSLYGASVEANTTLAATAADSGYGAPIIDGVGWIRDQSTTFSNTPTGHCDYICTQLRCPALTGWCSGFVGGACRRRFDPSECPIGREARRTGRDCGYVDLLRFCTP